MNKSTLTLCAVLACGSANADTLLGLDASAGIWQPAYSGNLGESNFNIDEFSFSEDNVTFLQAALEHPVPLLPNILIAHSRMQNNGVATMQEFVIFSDNYFLKGSDVSADLDLTHTDITLYYEVLDNWLNLDIGLTARQFKSALTLTSRFQNENIKASGYLPMAYALARFDLPFTGWSAIAQGNASAYQGDRHFDFTAKLRWDFVPAVDLAVEAGYRVMSLNLEEFSQLQTDLEIKGPYLGLNLPFEPHPVKALWLTDSQVNFCAKAYPTVSMSHDDAPALVVLGGYLRNGYLHRTIREQGGAYGGGASQDNNIGAFRFYSYRDPRMAETFSDFDASLDWLAHGKHPENQVEEAILGVIGGMDKPGSPAGEAKKAFYSNLHGRSHAVRQAFRGKVTEVTLEDLRRVSRTYLKPEKASIAVVTGNQGRAAGLALGLHEEKL